MPGTCNNQVTDCYRIWQAKLDMLENPCLGDVSLKALLVAQMHLQVPSTKWTKGRMVHSGAAERVSGSMFLIVFSVLRKCFCGDLDILVYSVDKPLEV